MEAKAEHLKLVQANIARMSSNSFLCKGWTVALVAALFAFGAKDADRVFVIIAWIPLIVFAGLDAYYLWQERLFRSLYEVVAAKGPDVVDYSMDVAPFKQENKWRYALVSPPILAFYASLAILLVVITVYYVLSPQTPVIPVQGPKTITITIQ